jgi:hypothetical protein
MEGRDSVEPAGLKFMLMLLIFRAHSADRKDQDQDQDQEHERNSGVCAAISLARSASDAKR